MADERGVTRYEVMPIPPIEDHTRYFDAGAVVIGVEYRLLDDAIAAASRTETAAGRDPGVTTGIDDRGVSLHVFGLRDGERLEHLRFDCFDEDPHYHYVSWRDRTNDMIHIDPVADGDPLEWALARIRTRLPQMLARAGAADVARAIEPERLEAILPQVTEAAYRARFEHDDAAIRRAALAGGTP
jgi:hypothetical protein